MPVTRILLGEYSEISSNPKAYKSWAIDKSPILYQAFESGVQFSWEKGPDIILAIRCPE